MDSGLIAKRKALITDAARELDKAKMMRFDEKSGNLYVTDLGRVASHFYIHYTSVETYNEMLKRHMNEAEVVYFFSGIHDVLSLSSDTSILESIFCRHIAGSGQMQV
jgi:replicative superfamily II helicase